MGIPERLRCALANVATVLCTVAYKALRIHDSEQVIGSSLETHFEYDADGKAVLMRPPKLLLYDDSSGKSQDIYLFLGRRPVRHSGIAPETSRCVSTRSQAAKREYAYGPSSPQADTKFGAFTQALYDEAKAKGWVVISMKDDWKQLFPFDA